jgi:hypothetical protein
MQDLEDIQIEIKKELGGASLNHLLHYLDIMPKHALVENYNCRFFCGYFKICFNYCRKEFDLNFILLNENKHCNNIFDQSIKFQRNLYDAIQFIKNINNK